MLTLPGLTPELWGAGYSQVGKAFGLGQLSKAEGFERILRAGGAEQPSYCAGAEALGITAVQIAGAELDGRVPATARRSSARYRTSRPCSDAHP